MEDSMLVKEYLRVHGVDNVLELDHDELIKEYEKTIREGIKYYHDLLEEDDSAMDFLEPKKRDVIEVLKKAQTTDEIYEILYEFLHVYTPTDLIAFMAEIKMPVPYTRLQRIIAIVHARVQEEVLDRIKVDLEALPPQERETLIAYYENMRDDIMSLAALHKKYRSAGTLEYLRSTAETKLNIMQSFLSKDLETEYKPFYDGSKEKRTLIGKILEISGIYTKNELFDMKIEELKVTHDEIMQQVLQKEREQQLIKKYIEIFEDFAGISEDEFKEYCYEMQDSTSEEIMSEIISHFTTKNHFISNKINNVLSSRDPSKNLLKNRNIDNE